MYRRRLVILSFLILTAMIASIYGIFFLTDKNRQHSTPIDNTSILAISENTETTLLDDGPLVDGEPEIEPVVLQDISVRGNTIEYDMKAQICAKSTGEIFLKLEYYYDGATIVTELESDLVPVLKSLENDRKVSLEGNYSTGVKEIYLNPAWSKAYILAIGPDTTKGAPTSIYSLHLKDSSISEMFSNTGVLTGPFFTKDNEYMGFSFEHIYQDHPKGKASILKIANCANDEYLEIAERDEDLIFDYIFLAWQSNSVAKLSQVTTPRDSNRVEDFTDKAIEVLYNINQNTFTYTGEEMAAQNSQEETTAAASEVKSGPSDTLREFYKHLSDREKYQKAVDILHEDFKLKMSILTQLGMNELGKEDIDLEKASLYVSLLKSSKLESIVKEEISQDNSTVYYYQTIDTGDDSQIKIPLKAELKKTEGFWRIISIKDGDSNSDL